MEDREFVRLAAGGKTMYWVDGNGNGNGKGGEVVLVDDEVNDEVEGIVDEGVFGFVSIVVLLLVCVVYFGL